MRQCWMCRTTKDEGIGIHHTNGNHSENRNNSLWNKINLCRKCHDLVQGICDKCANQNGCYVKKLQQCWAFSDALPPIFYRERMKEMEGFMKDDLQTEKSSKKGIETIMKPISPCRMMLVSQNDKLVFTCLFRKIIQKIQFPCFYSTESGCRKD